MFPQRARTRLLSGVQDARRRFQIRKKQISPINIWGWKRPLFVDLSAEVRAAPRQRGLQGQKNGVPFRQYGGRLRLSGPLAARVPVASLPPCTLRFGRSFQSVLPQPGVCPGSYGERAAKLSRLRRPVEMESVRETLFYITDHFRKLEKAQIRSRCLFSAKEERRWPVEHESAMRK